MTNSSSSKTKGIKDKSDEEKRNDKLREKYAKEMENYEKTSNKILEAIRSKGVSVHAPNPTLTPKQSPEEITDIHIVFSQQLPEYALEGEDDSEEQELKYKSAQTATTDTSNDDDSSSDSKNDSDTNNKTNT